MQLNQNKLLVTYLLLDVGKQRMRLHALGTASRPKWIGSTRSVCVYIYTHTPSAADSLRPRGGTQWFEPRSGIQVSKKQNISALLTRKDWILWGSFVTER